MYARFTIFKGHISYIVLIKYLLSSLYCTKSPWSLFYTQELVPLNPLPLYGLSPLVTTGSCSISVSLFLVCYIH